VNLFVYGTLMRGMPFPMAAFLEQNAVFRWEGCLPGRLFDLGGYPGLVYLPQHKNRVPGHVFELANPGMVLTKLDAYEMYYPEAPERSEYLRVAVPVETSFGLVGCQTYVFNRPVEGLMEIPDGNWLAWFHSRESPVDPGSFRAI